MKDQIKSMLINLHSRIIERESKGNAFLYRTSVLDITGIYTFYEIPE